MPPTETSKVRYPALTAPAQKTSGVTSTALIPVAVSISDIIVPGLGVTINIVLGLIKDICTRLLRRKHDRLQRVSKRLTDLYELATKMESERKFLPPDWLQQYGDLVAHFRAFMVSCEERNVFVRLLIGGAETKQVLAFEVQVDGLFGSMHFYDRGGGGCCVQ